MFDNDKDDHFEKPLGDMQMEEDEDFFIYDCSSESCAS